MLDSTVKLNSVLNGPLAPLGRGLGEGNVRDVKFNAPASPDAMLAHLIRPTVNVFYYQ